jgi:hypothetical protein
MKGRLGRLRLISLGIHRGKKGTILLPGLVARGACLFLNTHFYRCSRNDCLEFGQTSVERAQLRVLEPAAISNRRVDEASLEEEEEEKQRGEGWRCRLRLTRKNEWMVKASCDRPVSEVVCREDSATVTT